MQHKGQIDNSICTFIHYSTQNKLPYHVRIFVNQLALHFEKVVVLTNNKSLIPDFRKLYSNISFWYDQNLGYDFGLFYRFFQQHNLLEYDKVGIVNDSNLLVNTLENIFEWGANQEVDFWGVIDSNEKPWFSIHDDNYHIQSHFVVLNRKAVSFLPELFDEIILDEIFNESDPKKLRRLVINNWEIKLSQFLLKKDLTCASYVESEEFLLRHNCRGKNATIKLYSELMDAGYPLLKKKVIGKSWRSLLGRQEPWENVLLSNIHRDWNVQRILQSIKS